jgi:glycosyltransferase involved in cell wall biosynthesis
MRVALVHDYLVQYGGAEKVLQVLAEMFPQAPIYTAFYKTGSKAHKAFKHRDLRPSFAQRLPFFVDHLHSPLRFLAPIIWESFNFDDYDLVISSASWYITKGIMTRPETVHICYCHTPPRYLYGYTTSVEWQKKWLIRQYARVVNKYMRQYDYVSAQRVDYFVANSKEVQARIKKFYGRDSKVVYPPVQLSSGSVTQRHSDTDYFLTGGRLVGAKHFDLIIEAANVLQVPLKIYGDGPLKQRLMEMAGKTVEFLGHVDENRLLELYAGAKAFVALAEDEDFGITPVEAMSVGTPVIALHAGGYKETIIEGKTGLFIKDLELSSITSAMKSVESQSFDRQALITHAQAFSKDAFITGMQSLVEQVTQQKDK